MRSARLIINDMNRFIKVGEDIANERSAFQSALSKYAVSILREIPTDITPGDQMTGWEIIASLPMEEQLGEKLKETISKLTNLIGYGHIFEQTKICNIFEALSTLFEWDGERWNEVNE